MQTGKPQKKGVAFGKSSSDDNFCETLTASSEESPIKPSRRVEIATQLTKKAYIEDIKDRLDDAGFQCQHSIREFGPRKMKAAYQGIN